MISESLNNKNKWINSKLNVLIPMAGRGSRFEDSGYSFPKPLIEVNQKPMIQVAVENLNIDANYIYVVQKHHLDEHNLELLLNLITPGCKIIETDGQTEGAACTALLAEQFIDNGNPIFFANSDQFVEWNSNEFMLEMNETDADGGIVTFKSTNPHFSYVKLDENGLIQRVAKNEVISDMATTGYYYWKHGSDFVKYADQMISKNIRVNNEFYVDPVYNEAIEDGKEIRVLGCEKFWSLGTPEELDYYLENYKGREK